MQQGQAIDSQHRFISTIRRVEVGRRVVIEYTRIAIP